MEIRDKTRIFFRQDVPTQGKCCLYPPLPLLGGLHCASLGMQVLLSVLQSVSKVNPTEQRKKKHLFRSAALICSHFAQLPMQAKEIHDRYDL